MARCREAGWRPRPVANTSRSARLSFSANCNKISHNYSKQSANVIIWCKYSTSCQHTNNAVCEAGLVISAAQFFARRGETKHGVK